jgi:hypothetical protein
MWETRSNAAQRFAERREREDGAPRLLEVIPGLKSLELDIQERRGTWPAPTPEGSYLRHVVVSSAPALFFITCHDPECRDGGHDLTSLVMRALRSHETRFEAVTRCQGRLGSADCQRTISVVGKVSYEARPTVSSRSENRHG